MSIIQGDGFIVNVIKSPRRKTMALKVTAKGAFIHIPTKLNLDTAEQFITKKSNWIQRKLQQQHEQKPIERLFNEGEQLLYLGEHYPLQLLEKDLAFSVNKTLFHIELSGRLNHLSKAAIRAALIHWYKQQAEAYLTTRTLWFANKLGLQPNSITIKTYRARWGSCKSNGDIQYNWKIILAPPEVIDYVIVHELCHLQHHNHSAAFWLLVKYSHPNFKTDKMWLKNNGYKLEI